MALIYSLMGTYSVDTSTSFIPDFNTFLYYIFFYLVGWVLFKSKHLLDTMKKSDWLSSILGVILFSIYFFMQESLSYEVRIIIKSLMVWFFIFGITGLFIRYGSNHSSKMRYISDSSYWVYLIHLPLTAIIPGLISDWPLPATLKFLLVLIITSIISFVTYHYFVRASFVGKFLNGRKYSRKLKDIKPQEKINPNLKVVNS
jgi:peptidoglycan/LPS O-acetylase OafA/YrhL